MKAGTILARTVLLVSVVIMGAWSCAGRPFDPPRADEIPKEPGIFTKGADGAVLYDSNKERSPAETPSKHRPPHQRARNSLLLNPTMRIMKSTDSGCFGKSQPSVLRNMRNFNNGGRGENTGNGKNKSKASYCSILSICP